MDRYWAIYLWQGERLIILLNYSEQGGFQISSLTELIKGGKLTLFGTRQSGDSPDKNVTRPISFVKLRKLRHQGGAFIFLAHMPAG
jgi:hypothetical protein